MATQLFQPPYGTPAWFHDMASKARDSGRTITSDVMLTPELAGELLRNNPENRGIRVNKINQLVKDIKAGRWTFNGEPILISKEGLLNDGQHRAFAVVEAGLPVQVLMTFGLERSSRTTLDQGVARVASDYMMMLNIVSGVCASSLTRFLIAWENSGGKSIGRRSSISNAEIIAKHQSDSMIDDAARFANRYHKDFKRLATPQIIGFCHAVLCRINRGQAEFFLQQVCVGENITKSDPAFAVRAGLSRPGLGLADKVHLIFRGWNAMRQKRSPKNVMIMGSTLPELV